MARLPFPLRAPSRAVLPFLLAVGWLAVVAGCSTASVATADDFYQAPPPGSAAATLRGSSIKEGGLFGSEHRGFVSMIDLKPVSDAPAKWDEPIAVSPGKRNITVEYHYSNFMTRAYVTFDALPGANYQLMIKNTREPTAEVRMYNDFWIVDLATGNPVTPVYHRQVTGGKKGTIFYQNK